MKRFIIATTAAAALLTAPMAFGSDDAMTEQPAPYESSNVIPRFDAELMGLTKEEYIALVRAIDEDFDTIDGERLGVVRNLAFDENGQSVIVIELADRANIDAQYLVIKPTSDSILLRDGTLFLNVSAEDLYERVKAAARRTDSNSVTVIVL